MLDLHRLVKNLSIDKMDKGGTKHTGVPVKTLKKLLKKAGLKVSGKKATLTRRAKKARLLGGGPGGIGAIKGLPAAVLTPEQLKAKVANDKYQAEIAAQKQDHENRKIAAEEEYRRVNYTGGPVENDHSFVKGVKGVLNAFRGGAKKKTRRS
jgi:hypothetical protein